LSTIGNVYPTGWLALALAKIRDKIFAAALV
jgi:hypothetical protein